jgi:phosphoribosylformylglycinamidine synthase
LAIALAECCIGNRLGADINLDLTSDSPSRWDAILFGEGGARILVSVHPRQRAAWEDYLQEIWGDRGRNWHHLGTVNAARSALRIATSHNLTLIEVGVSEMADRYEGAIERRLS